VSASAKNAPNETAVNAVLMDLQFTDGTYLHTLAAPAGNGGTSDPTTQGAKLGAGQWQQVTSGSSRSRRAGRSRASTSRSSRVRQTVRSAASSTRYPSPTRPAARRIRGKMGDSHVS